MTSFQSESLGMSRLKLLFCGTQTNGFPSISLACQDECSFVKNTISPLISEFKHGHLTQAQTIDSSKIGQALNEIKLCEKAC